MTTNGAGEWAGPPSVTPDELDVLYRRVIAVVGHELRTPITTLRGLADALEVAGEGDRPALIEAVARNARRLERLADDLLLAAGVLTALPGDALDVVSLAATAGRVWDGEHDGELEIQGDAEVLCRPASLERILRNLFANAVAYGEPPVRLAIGPSGATVRAEVSSPGPPVSEQDLQLACEPFYRGEHAVTRAAGLGVGLAVARALARHDGGDLRLEARPGGGVVACLELRGAP